MQGCRLYETIPIGKGVLHEQSEKTLCLEYLRDFTTQLFGIVKNHYKGANLNNQYDGKDDFSLAHMALDS